MLNFNDISRAALLAFFCEISQLLWMGSNFTCMFLMMIQICSASLMKFGELWKKVEISWYFKGWHCLHFLWNKSTSLNGLKFYMHVSDDDSNKFCKFGEIWCTLKKCWNLMIFLGPALLAFFFEKIYLLWKGSYLTCMFLMMIPICSASWWNLMNFEIMLKFHDISKGWHCRHFSMK